MSQSASNPTGAITDIERRPLVSAIVITRNKESYIRECLSGLMEQSVANRMEVIVVDEGSEQSEWAVIADLQRRHKNLISLRTAGGSGINLALRIASGKYLTVLEATDRMKQDGYEMLAAALEKSPEAMLAYGDTCFTAIPHESLRNHTSYGKMIWPEYSFQQLAQPSPVAPHPLWRRELHDSIGGFGAGDQGHDMRDFMLRVVERFRIVHLQEFTGLKLVPAAAPLIQEAARHEPAPPRQERWNGVEEPKATSRVPVSSAPAPRAEPSADEAYAAIQSLSKGVEHQLAVSALEKHLERYPDHAIAHNDLAAVSYQLGEKEKAVSHYRAAVRLSPDEATYQKNLADMLYIETGEVDEAIAIYLELLKSSPRDVETLLNLGIISDGVGQAGEAESFFQRALEIEPWNQAVRERLTELRGREVEAARLDDDETAEERYERSQTLVAQGDTEAAARELEGIVDSFPDFSPAHNDLAVLYYQNGAKDEALMHYQKAAALVPGNSTFQKNLADFYFVEGRDVDGAIAIYLELLRKEPKNIETLMSLGKICMLLDRPQEAESFYGKVTQLEPWNRDARECLSTLRQCANG
ncbi:MAG: glycosyl transferase [Geobacteraceae bacterium GWC2_58_44]|nr:MAG: glycosyl transferase [Geobacteraceae bacterium GWC2_58_44]